MKALRLTFIILISIILATGIPYLGYLLYRKFNVPDVSPMNAIPERSALIVRINRPMDLYEEAGRSNLLWKEVRKYSGLAPLREELGLLDSLAASDKQMTEILRENPLYIVLSYTGRSDFGLLYMIKTGLDHLNPLAMGFFEKKYPVRTKILISPYASGTILRVHLANQKDPLYMTLCQGVFIMSYHQELVKKAIDRLSLNTQVIPSGTFNSVEASAGKKVDANVFIYIPYFSVAAWKLVAPEKKPQLVRFARFGDWCGLDLLVKKDELLLNGFTNVSDSSYQTLALWAGQSPQPIGAVGVLPDNVSSFILYGFQDLGQYLARNQLRETRPETNLEPGRLTQFNRSHGKRLELFFLPWTGHEVCFARLESRKTGSPEYPFIAVQCLSEDTARAQMRALADLLRTRTDSVKYRDHTIYESQLSEGINAFFGAFMLGVNTGCYMFHNGYAIFSDEPDHLCSAVDHYLSGKTLDRQKAYLDLGDNISDLSNLFFYSKPGRSLPGNPPVFTEGLTKFFNFFGDSLSRFEGITFQVVNREGLFYTSLSARFNPSPAEEGPLVWSAALDTLAAGAPRIVVRSTTGERGVLVTDTANTLYMVDKSGTILWKQKLYGRVLGTIHEIRLKTSDSVFYIFNTENHLYLIRSDGQIAERFPLKFPIRATSGITVTDYNGTGEYRILVAFRDNKVYNFDLNGVSVDGWQRPSLGEEIVRPVQYLVKSHKDYLIITGKSGQVLIADRRGNPRIRPERSFRNSPNSPFYLNLSSRKALFVTTDLKGRVDFIQENGRITTVTCGNFSPEHFFLSQDLEGKGSPDYIFFDRNSIYYYDQSFRLVYAYPFPHAISPPLLVRTVNGRTYIGAFSPAGREIYLFDHSGIVETESAIRGTTQFDLGGLEQDDRLNLVIGSGRFLRCFRLAQF